MYFVGMIFGGAIAMVLLSMLISLMLFAEKEPIPRAVATVMTAWIFASIFATFGGGNFVENVIVYGLGGGVAFFERKRHYEKNWIDSETSELHETFR